MKIFSEEFLKTLVIGITPGKYEPVYQVSQLFETGIRVTYWFVVRNGNIYYYDEKIEKDK